MQVVVSPDGYGDGVMALDIDADEFQARLVRVCSRESNFNLRQEFGKLLFNTLFTGDVRDRWKGSIGRVRGSPRPIGLRLLLRIQDARLSLLPWELLYDQQAGGFLGATANQTVSRFLPMAEPEDFRAPEKLRVLLIIQSPPLGASDKLKPIPEKEIAGLELAIANLSPNGVEFTVLPNPSMTAIFEELQRQEYHVLHYLGHGSPGELYLVAEGGQPFTAIDDVSFSYWFAGRKSLRLIVLNACGSSQVEGAGLFSGIGPASVSIGVPAVIAMQYDAVYADTASLFSERFYAGLAAGRPVDVAVNEARQFLSSKYQAERDWSTPVLYMGTRSGRILTLPGSAQEQDLAQMAQALAKVTAAMADVGQHHAELDRRASRLRDWLTVQSALSKARADVDRMYRYVLDALNEWKPAEQIPVNTEKVHGTFVSMEDYLKAQDTLSQTDVDRLRSFVLEALNEWNPPDQIPVDTRKVQATLKSMADYLKAQGTLSVTHTVVDRLRSYVLDALNEWKPSEQVPGQVPGSIARVRAKLESMADEWREHCSEDLKRLRKLPEECSFIAQADLDAAGQQGTSSPTGWAADLDRMLQESAAFEQDMATVPDGDLKSSCSELDNRCRRLRDWLRERDAECRNHLEGESRELAKLTELLRRPAKADGGH